MKNYSINRSDLTTHYNVGKILSEAGKHYGESIVVIEIKVTKLNSNHTGQIQNDQYVINYCSDDRIIAREYELV